MTHPKGLQEAVDSAVRELQNDDIGEDVAAFLEGANCFLSNYQDSDTLIVDDLVVRLDCDEHDHMPRIGKLSTLIAEYRDEAINDYSDVPDMSPAQREEMISQADRLSAVAKMAEDAAQAIREAAKRK